MPPEDPCQLGHCSLRPAARAALDTSHLNETLIVRLLSMWRRVPSGAGQLLDLFGWRIDKPPDPHRVGKITDGSIIKEYSKCRCPIISELFTEQCQS